MSDAQELIDYLDEEADIEISSAGEMTELGKQLRRMEVTARSMSRRIEELEAKLAQAVEALELADAAMAGAHMNRRVVERKVEAAIVAIKGTQE
jgi:hypothetical protein